MVVSLSLAVIRSQDDIVSAIDDIGGDILLIIHLPLYELPECVSCELCGHFWLSESKWFCLSLHVTPVFSLSLPLSFVVFFVIDVADDVVRQ